METQTANATQPQTSGENAKDRFIRKTRELFAKETDLDQRWNGLRPILAELLADPDMIAASESWPDCVPANGRGENLLYLGTRLPFWDVQDVDFLKGDNYQRITNGMLDIAFETASVRTVIVATKMKLDRRTGAVATAVDYNMPVVWVVMNNAKLGMAYDIQKLVGIENPVASHFRPVNIARVAEGHDAVGLRITKPGELAELLPKAIASGRPTVFDCVIAREAIPPLAPYLEGQTAFFKRADML